MVTSEPSCQRGATGLNADRGDGGLRNNSRNADRKVDFFWAKVWFLAAIPSLTRLHLMCIDDKSERFRGKPMRMSYPTAAL
jgi:hypothetical protein